jgi:hypothetical protein
VAKASVSFGPWARQEQVSEGGKVVLTRKIGMERLTFVSSKSFDAVVAAVE